MHADHYFEIGHSHQVCQDYAMSGGGGRFAYAIVCDGCSSSPDVDFGARALALAGREVLHIVARSSLPFDAFGALAIGKASAMFPIFPGLDSRALDATLLAAWVDGDHASAYLFGDGVFFHKTATSLSVVRVSFAPMLDDQGIQRGPGPAYLAYNINEARKERYLERSTGNKTIYRGLIASGQPSGSEASVPQFDPVVVQATVGPGDVVGVISDGIESFWRNDSTPMSWMDVLPEFTAFKNYNGVFVHRRLGAMKRMCHEQAIVHKDDISEAAICV